MPRTSWIHGMQRLLAQCGVSRTVGVSAVCVALQACNFAPEYRQPDLPIGAVFDGPANAGTLVSEMGWEAFFGDPQLQYLIARALARNRDLAASVARIEQAGAFYRIQRSGSFPRIDAVAGASRTKTPLGAVDPEFADSSTSITFNQYNAQAALASFELDFWGRVANLNEAAGRRYLATVEAQRAFRLYLIGNVAATYYSIRAGEEGIDLAQRTVTSREYALEIARLRLDAGVTSTVDFEQATILLTQAQTQLADLQRSTGLLRNRLTVLVGGPVDEPLPLPRPIDDPGQFGELDAGLPSALLVRRPDIQQAEQLLRAESADIGAARAEYFPRVALTGNFGFVSPELSNLFSSGMQAWSIGGSLVAPIFDAGQRRAQVDQTLARQDELVATYQRTVQTAFSEVSDALIGRQRYREQIEAQVRAVEAQRRLAETAELRYLNGISIYLEVVDARRNQFTAEQQLIQLRATALQNGVSLYLALGGGPDEQATPAAPIMPTAAHP